ncbi:MAG: PBP1A family penicillin-binding protein [Desulfobulbaceae bacterium]|nr:PBP1A family penicillin-binding protein [Desulfobulbaceae bacterium]
MAVSPEVLAPACQPTGDLSSDPANGKVYGDEVVYIFLLALWFVALAAAIVFCQGLLWLNLPALGAVTHYQPSQGTLIYDRNGRVVERIAHEYRIFTPLADMHPMLPKAFVAAEDGRFYRHDGLDFLSIPRALYANLKDGKKSQGASTITQQVARVLLLTPEKTYLRKLKEAILAWRINQVLTKEQILTVYLNEIYLGRGAYGVEAAAQVYFGKESRGLTLAEVALLAGLTQAPSRYSPEKSQEAAIARQRYVLNRMAEDGYISQDEARAAFAAPLSFRDKAQADPSPVANANVWYLDLVKRRAAEILNQPLAEAGAKIYTFLDPALQEKANDAVEKGGQAVAARSALLGQRRPQPQAALVCIEPDSGRVVAVVGGLDVAASSCQRAAQARRPAGSVFKPLVYAAALEHGWQPDSLIDDTPLTVDTGQGGTWSPKNADGKYRGQISLSQALAISSNVAAVRLLRQVGIEPVRELARQAGIASPIPSDLSLALGAVDVSLIDMTAAFAIFANNGMFHEPVVIDHIETADGQYLSGGGGGRRVLPEDVAGRMKTMLAGVVREGTGSLAALPGSVAGKTGTSSDNRDAWFIGFTDHYLAGVWVGYDHNEELGEREGGGRTAAPIWRNFIRAAGK